MIDLAVNFLRQTLNTALQAEKLTVTDDTTAEQDLVVFLDGDKQDPLSFLQNAVTAMLVNVREETTMRRAEPFRSQDEDGRPLRVTRPLHLELSLLFVARFRKYDAGLKMLSGILQYFQENPLFTPQSHPDLPDGIDKLAVELISMTQSEQNEIWNALRSTYMPSIVYRTRLLIVRDRAPVVPDIVTEATPKLDQIDPNAPVPVTEKT